MSRRKQANPAKLGETESTDALEEEEDTPSSSKEMMMGMFKNGGDNNVFDDVDIKEEDEILDDDDEDEDDGSLLNGQGSSPSSSSEQASPASSCQSSLSDTPEAEEPYTMGATATTPYECNICKRAFARSSLLSKHVQTHTEQLQFSCPYCRRLFKHKRSRDRHTKLHTGDKKYKCLHCDSAFARSDHLKIHMKTHDNKKPHQCELCNRGYNTAAALASHQQHHSKQEQRRCGSSASRSSAVSTPSPGNFRCLQCPDTFEKPEHLQNHLQVSHKNISPPASHPNNLLMDASFNILKTAIDLPKIACMYCGKDFLSMNHMYQHIHSEHRAIFNSISQSFTPLPSPVMENLSPKTSRQNSSPTYACDRCTMRFDSPILLQEHIENVHWGPTGLYKYDFTTMSNSSGISNEKSSHSLAATSQSKPTDLSRKRRSENPLDFKLDKRKADEAALVSKQTSSPSTGSPYESNDKPCICSYCYAQMPNFKMFLLHMETHVSMSTPSTPLPLSTNNVIGCCPLCGEPARSTLELGRHIFSHAISNVTARCCHCCKKPFDQIDDLQKHLLEAHSQTVYKCSICNDIFETQLALQMHFSNKHSPECKHYRCNLCCDQVFHDRLTAELHVNMKHSIQAPLSSSVRNYHHMSRFPEIETRAEFSIYQCPFCQKAFKDEYLQYVHILKEHNEVREGENYLLDSSNRRIPSASPNVAYSKTSSSPDKIDLGKIGNYSCEICNRSDIASEAELTAHKKLHHAKTKVGTLSLQCAYCNEHCKSRNDLENHMKSHQVSCGKGKHKCNICDEIFTSNGTLAEHKLSHCKIVAGSSCTQCKAVLLDEQSFYNHQLQHSNTSAINKQNSQISLPANCIICCQTLQTDVEIKLHAKFHLRHLLQKELICAICNKMCDNHLLKHVEKNNINVPICIECMKATNGSSPSSLIASQSKLFACLKCSQTFDTEDEIKAHTTEHMMNEEPSLECHLCRNVLPSPTKLQVHLIEHNFMGMGQYRCYVCSSVFTTAMGLRTHIIAHGLIHRPYECTDCKMKFFFETELENHRYVHLHPNMYTKNGSEYFECKSCGRSFNDNIYYKEHVQSCPMSTKDIEQSHETKKIEIKKEELNTECEHELATINNNK
ncbi:PREDICTED: zinc finger protein 423 [Nicrophorus vespilloides]|uniref:Zinc finger protein 423 n=1 Tax=Nicrophorus vespilloides TaxID=110193 RepID=A0ABM1MHJ6_NICVS|nr:PREDICTED: zinc finger protein 423 [Nicrophorus vespilloides]